MKIESTLEDLRACQRDPLAYGRDWFYAFEVAMRDKVAPVIGSTVSAEPFGIADLAVNRDGFVYLSIAGRDAVAILDPGLRPSGYSVPRPMPIPFRPLADVAGLALQPESGLLHVFSRRAVSACARTSSRFRNCLSAGFAARHAFSSSKSASCSAAHRNNFVRGSAPVAASSISRESRSESVRACVEMITLNGSACTALPDSSTS